MLNHPPREVNRLAPRALLASCLGLIGSGCDKPPPPTPQPETDPVEQQLDVQLEVMHQTREVLRYMEEEERLHRRREAELVALADNATRTDDDISQEQPPRHD